MWKLYAFVILSACAATTLSQSQCDVDDINDCTISFAHSVGNGTTRSDVMCRVASNFVMCLNRLTSCINNPAFTQARRLMESMNLDNMCPGAFQYPYTNSVGAPTITTACLLVSLVMLCIFK